MMIETSLISLENTIQDGQTLSSGAKVILPSGDEAEIYGFLIAENNILSRAINMPPLGECYVLSNRVIFSMDKILYNFPIFKSVSKAREEKYNLYLLYISRFFTDLNEYHKKYYIQTMCNEKPHDKVDRIEGIETENDESYYITKNNDLYFKSSSKLRGIGSGFEVITRRYSKLTDNIKYEIFDPYSVMIDKKDIPSAPTQNPFQII